MASKQETAPEVPQENSAPAPEVTAAPETPAVTLESLDEFGQLFVARTSSHIAELNSVVTEIRSASEDGTTRADAMYELLRSTPDTLPEGFSDETVTPEFLAKYDEIVKAEVAMSQAIRSAANSYAANSATAVTPERLAELETKRQTLAQKVTQARKSLATEFPGAENLLPDILGGKSAGSGAGRGSGGRKMRGFTVSVDGAVKTLPAKKKNEKGEEVTVQKSSFAAAATSLGIPTPDLQAAYFAAVGTDDVEKLPATADFVIKGADDKEHNVTAVKDAE